MDQTHVLSQPFQGGIPSDEDSMPQ
jgi:hypothetical protein